MMFVIVDFNKILNGEIFWGYFFLFIFVLHFCHREIINIFNVKWEMIIMAIGLAIMIKF